MINPRRDAIAILLLRAYLWYLNIGFACPDHASADPRRQWLYLWSRDERYEADASKLYGRILEVRPAFEQRLLSTVGDEELRALGVVATALDDLERQRPNLAKRIASIRRGNLRARGLDI